MIPLPIEARQKPERFTGLHFPLDAPQLQFNKVECRYSLAPSPFDGVLQPRCQNVDLSAWRMVRARWSPFSSLYQISRPRVAIPAPTQASTEPTVERQVPESKVIALASKRLVFDNTGLLTVSSRRSGNG